MNSVGKMGVGVAACAAILIVDYCIGNAIGYQADVKACKTLTPAEVSGAVVADVTHPDKRIFHQFPLAPSHIVIEKEAIQIGPSSVLAPFRIASDPARHYFAMLHCSDLENIDYASD